MAILRAGLFETLGALEKPKKARVSAANITNGGREGVILAMSIREVSRAIARCVDSKVGMLQSGYLASRASSRASRARLRRLDTAGEASWMSVGEELFADLPNFSLGEETERKELESVRAALQLYAILQQSRKSPVATFPTDGGNAASFGNACRLYVAASNGDGESGVKRRLSSIEGSYGFFWSDGWGPLSC